MKRNAMQWTGRRAVLTATVLATAVGFTIAGCDTTPRAARNAFDQYQVGNYAAAVAEIRPLAGKKDENYVLNNCRLGSCALAAGNLNDAENAFMNAYRVLDATGVNDAGRQLGAAVVWEGIKVWKGEPFEQAMAHYYLGVIFLLQGDYENARAAFENSLFKVHEYASKDDFEHYQMVESNFALGYFGLGFCYLRLNQPDKAQAAFARAQQINPALANLIAQAQQPGVNTLIFVDEGRGPRKAAKGWYDEQSVFGPTPAQVGPVPQITAFADGNVISNPQVLYSTVDTLAMAQERRWQDIDTLREAKAIFGTGAMAAGAGMMAYGADRGNRDLEWAGLGTALFGAAVAASSQADTRQWGMLPRTVYIIPAIVAPGTHVFYVQAGGSQSAPLTTTIAPPDPAHPRDNVFYFRLLPPPGVVIVR